MLELQVFFNYDELMRSLDVKSSRQGGLPLPELKMILSALRPGEDISSWNRKYVIAALQQAYESNALAPVLRHISDKKPAKQGCDNQSELSLYECALFDNGYSVVSLPKDANIYHGNDRAHARNFSFYGPMNTAYVYGRRNKVSEYKTNQRITLLDLSSHSNLFHLVHDESRFSDDELFELRVYTGYNVEYYPDLNPPAVQTLEDGRLHELHFLKCRRNHLYPFQMCTSAFLTSDDESKELHLARKILQLICEKFELDGFINFGILHEAHTNNKFHAEIGLCNMTKIEFVGNH